MKIIQQSYEILDDISDGGVKELQKIEKAARTCYKSEDKISANGESAQKLIRKLIENGHEAMLEHSCLTVKFITDRGVTHELVRHRMASFAQESTRYCNYSNDKFGNEITVVEPIIFNDMDNEWREDVAESLHLLVSGDADRDHIKDYIDAPTKYKMYAQWYVSLIGAEDSYIAMTECGVTPQMARSVLPNSLKAEIVVTANYREWRHILDLRAAAEAHPQIRALMKDLLIELHKRIPVIFDDIYAKHIDEEGA